MKRALAAVWVLALAGSLACVAPAQRSADPTALPAQPAAATATLTPRLGRHATPAEIAALDIDIAPDGAGLPLGAGTAEAGAAVFAERCASCHGSEGAGGPADALVGGIGTLAGPKPLLSVGSFWPYATTLFDYIRRAMPYDSPGSLTNDEVYALTAHLLERNGIVTASVRLDAASLPAVRMPNRDGFESAWPPGLP